MDHNNSNKFSNDISQLIAVRGAKGAMTQRARKHENYFINGADHYIFNVHFNQRELID